MSRSVLALPQVSLPSRLTSRALVFRAGPLRSLFFIALIAGRTAAGEPKPLIEPVIAPTACTVDCSSAPAGMITTDGCLQPEVLLTLDRSAPPGPDVLAGRRGAAAFKIDCVRDGNISAGGDGFRDSGLRLPDVPGASCVGPELCVDTVSELSPSYRSPFNTGKVPYIYLPDSDGLLRAAIIEPANGSGDGLANTTAIPPDIQVVAPGSPVDPGQIIVLAGALGSPLATTPSGDDVESRDPTSDDSVIYVGMDIANGKTERVPPIGTPFALIDVEDLNPIPGLCDDGVRNVYGALTNVLGMPFDVDGDGDATTIGRWTGLTGNCSFGASLRETRAKRYAVAFYTCIPQGADDPTCVNFAEFSKGREFGFFELRKEANTNFITLCVKKNCNPASFDSSIPLTGANRWIHTFPNPVCSEPPSSCNVVDDRARLCGRDVEFRFDHIDSLLDLSCPSDFSIDRFRLAKGGLQTFSDTDGDSAAEDHTVANWFVPLPQVEVKKQVRCSSSINTCADAASDTDWMDTVNALGRLHGRSGLPQGLPVQPKPRS